MTVLKAINLFVTIKSLTFRRCFVRNTKNKHAILCVGSRVSTDACASILELQYCVEYSINLLILIIDSANRVSLNNDPLELFPPQTLRSFIMCSLHHQLTKSGRRRWSVYTAFYADACNQHTTGHVSLYLALCFIQGTAVQFSIQDFRQENGT